MTDTREHPSKDFILIAALLTAAWGEVAMREAYYQFGTELANGSMLAAATFFGLLACFLARFCTRKPRRSPLLRVLALGALALALHVTVWPVMVASAQAHGVGTFGLVAVGASGALALIFAPDRVWGRLRPAMALSALLFVWTQPVIAWIRAPEYSWPPVQVPSASEPSDRLARPTATLVLLFDELNALHAAPFEAVLQHHGMSAHSKSIQAVDRNTHEVIPAMFAGGTFHDAKPCSTTAICAGDRILDFSKVQVTRPDVDVVGFYHPYCDMPGLRWCRRMGMSYFLSDTNRWRCALWRRTGWGGSLSPEECAAVHGKVWEGTRVSVLKAAKDAPSLRQGGVLFIHVPLPHPPGQRPGHTLAEDYRDNIARGARFLDELLTMAKASGLERRLVLFSDHPLRQERWCLNFVQYAQGGCRLDQSLDDSTVPLIVAAEGGDPLPSLQHIDSNREVFHVLREWPTESGIR